MQLEGRLGSPCLAHDDPVWVLDDAKAANLLMLSGDRPPVRPMGTGDRLGGPGRGGIRLPVETLPLVEGD
jgi:hypothetical protein